MTTTLWKIVATLALVAGCVALYFSWPQTLTTAQNFGAIGVKLAENYDPYIRYNGGYFSLLPLKLGTNGTAINTIVFGSCTIWAPANTITASTSQQAVCQGATTGGIAPIAGIPANGNCDVTVASSTSNVGLGLIIAGVSASSTAGNIVVNLDNGTGATYTWSSTASSSSQWNYTCFN